MLFLLPPSTYVSHFSLVFPFLLQPLNADAWVRSQVSRYHICGGQSGTKTGFPSSTFGFHLSVSFQQCSISIFLLILLLSEGQVGKAWDPSKKAMLFLLPRLWDRKVPSHLFMLQWLSSSLEQVQGWYSCSTFYCTFWYNPSNIKFKISARTDRSHYLSLNNIALSFQS